MTIGTGLTTVHHRSPPFTTLRTVLLLFASLSFVLVELSAQTLSPAVIAANSPIPDFLGSPDEASISIGLASTGSESIENLSDKNPIPLEPKRVYTVPSGPWGNLEFYVTYLQVPSHFLDFMVMPSDVTTWYFDAVNESELATQLASVGLATINGKNWLEMGQIHKPPGYVGLAFLPSEELVLGLTPDQRNILHGALSDVSKNRHSTDPIVIESGDPVTWYRDAGLDEDLVQLIASLCYQNQKAIVFSDISYVLSTIETLEKRRQFVRATTRTRTLMLRLNVENTNDFEGVIDYWTNGHKRKSILPILESIIETPGVERIDVAHLLPPTPRKLLFTYPGLSDYLEFGDQDCHWTALNFFQANPNQQAQIGILGEVVARDYVNATGALQFGDIIQFVKADSNTVEHSAVFIAGDIVFTKNGIGVTNPWVLMRYSDMEARYFSNNLVAKAVRKKNNYE